MAYYEVKGISQSSEIKNAYETAVANNEEFYRAISSSGRIYGWEGGHHVEANKDNAVEIDGEFWFKNDKYVAPVVEEPVEEFVEPTVDEILDEAVEAVEEIVEPKEEVVEETPVEKTETVVEPNYKALYEEEVAKNTDLEAKIIEASNSIEAVKGELEIVKTEFKEYKAIVEAFKAL